MDEYPDTIWESMQPRKIAVEEEEFSVQDFQEFRIWGLKQHGPVDGIENAEPTFCICGLLLPLCQLMKERVERAERKMAEMENKAKKSLSNKKK